MLKRKTYNPATMENLTRQLSHLEFLDKKSNCKDDAYKV